MSTTIDQRVVEMQFDNRHFEQNVSQTMSTLDKLKQKLHLPGASKGLEDVGNAARKVDMSPLGNSVENVRMRFSALEVMGVTALANITNSAVNAGKRIISALTIDPIKTGFQEYETQINAVQTILANTSSKGTTIDDVNVALDELNKYADMTIYNFTEMTRNIGTFTAAGIDLNTSVNAIQGIANLAAVSGSTSQQASTAMYQLSQALASGTVKLMDWNSVVNAGMGGQVFQDALKKTSEELGTGAEAAIKASGSFRESLKDGWLTADVLTATLKKFTSSGANEYVAEYTSLSVDAVEAAIKDGEAAAAAAKARGEEVDAIDHAAEALAKKSGKNKDEIKDALQFAKTATDAATKVKTFTQLWDVLKESAQSGWSQTWKIIVGDFEEAKELLTPLADTLTGFINKMSDVRNRILQVALDFTSPWTTMMEKLNGSGLGKIKEMAETVTNLGDKLEYYQNVVSRVWRGDYKNADTGRFEKLEAEGYDHRVVQDLVNKGSQYKLTVEDIEASHKKFGLTMEKSTEETKEATKSVEKLSDSTLKNAGFTEEEIRLYRALESEADRLGISVSELAEEMSNTNGRDLLIESFKNIGDIFVGTGKAIKEAWVEIFNPPSLEVFGIRLYGVIKSIKDFTESLRLTNKDTGELNDNGLKVQRTLKGIFAALDIVLTVVGGPLKIAFKLLTQLLGAFGFNILDVTAFVGDMLVKFRDFIDGALDFSGVFEKIANPIKNALETFKKWITSLKESENLPQDIALGIASGFGKAFTAIKNFFKKLPEYFSNGFADLKESPLAGFIAKLKDGLGVAGETIAILGDMIREKIKKFLSRSEFAGISADSIAGLVNGFKDGASNAWNAAVEMVTNLVQKVKDFLGIESPSKVFFAIGGFIIAGLIAGLQNGIPDSLGAIKDVFQPMLDWIKNIDFGPVFAGIIGIGTTATVYKGVDGISSLFGGLGDLFAGTGEVLSKSAKPIAKVVKNTAKVVKSFSKVLDGIAFSIKVDAIRELAESLGKTLLMLVAAIAILTFFEPAELWNAVGIVAVLALILVGLAFAMDKLNSASATIGKGGVNIQGLSSGLTGIGMAILLIGATVKMIGSMDPEQAKQGFLALVGMVAAIGAFLIAFMKIPFGPDDALIVMGLGRTMKQIATALLLMTLVVKLLGGMDRGTLIQGGIAITAFAGIVVGLIAASKLIGGRENKNIAAMGTMLLKIALAIGVMAIVAKLLGSMDPMELIQGGLAIVAFSGVIVGLMAAARLITGSKNVDKIGDALLKIGLVIGIMALTVKLLGNMTPGEILQGTLAIAAFSGIIVGLIAATKLVKGNQDIDKIGGAILAVSGAIAIMAFTAFLLSMVSWEGFAKGTIMVTIFAGIIVGLIAATKLVGNNADKISKTIITIAAAIAALGLVAVLLSLVPVENLKKGITAVAALSAIMAVLIAVTKLAQNCMGTVIAITAAIAVLAGALYLLSTVPSESLLPAVLALGSMLLVMTGVLAALGFIGKMAKDAALGALALATLAVPLALFGLVLAMMSALKVTDAIPNVIALSVLCTVLTALLIPLSAIGLLLMATGGIILLGVAALALMAVPLVAFVGIIALMAGIQNGIANAMALTTLMAVIGDVLFKISLVAPLAAVGVTAIYAMIGLMTALGVLATAIGALVTQFPQLQTFLDTGIGLLEQLAGGLGQVIGSFVAGFASEVMAILPDLGQSLTDFMGNAQGFIDGAKAIDDSVVSGVKALAETILIITAADILQGLTSLIKGSSSLESFAEQLPLLGKGIVAFSESLGTFSEDQLTTIACAAQAIKTLAQASSEIPNSGGLLAQIVGENDLGTFAAQFPVLGSGLKEFLNSVGTFSDEQVATVNSAAQAIKSLAQASSEIPNTGGLLADIVGDNELGTFAAQFPTLGTGLRGFLDNVGTFSDEQVATVDSAAAAVKSLAQASSEIPNTGGLLAEIVGENGLGTFAAQFPILGTGLRGFLDNVGTFSTDQCATVDSAASAVKSLATVAQSIPGTGGLLQDLIGEADLGTFASSFPKVGEGIKGFTDKLGTFDAAKVNTVQAGVNAVKAISGLASVDLAGLTSNLDEFGSEVVLFGSSLSRFCEKLPPAADLDGAIEQMNKIIAVTKSLGSTNSEVWGTLADNLKKVGENAVNKFVGAFTSKTAKTDLKEAAEKLGDKVVDGIEAKEKAVKTAGEDAAKEAVAGVRKQYDKMKSAGKYLVDGFAAGITEKTWYAEAKAKAMANAAEKAAKEALDINSPSKVFRAIGYSVPEGFAMGIDKMGRLVTDSSVNMTKNAMDNVKRSISRISDLVGTDIDSQPTIRPVLDLSDVKSGTSLLSDMLSMDSSVGVSANVGAISSMMSMRSQNGGNDDIISELAKLRKDIGNISNTTYQVNGVTYDDGSNVANAVGTLARAIRIERRV